MGRRPQLLDSVLDPDFFDPLPDCQTLAVELDAALAEAHDYQDALDAFRCWLNLAIGTVVFWGLIARQIYHDASTGEAELFLLLVFTGVTNELV